MKRFRCRKLRKRRKSRHELHEFALILKALFVSIREIRVPKKVKEMANLFYKDESYAIVGAAMEVHRTLGWGYLENVYQAALAHELTLRNIPFEQQKHLPVQYKTAQIGDYVARAIASKS